MRALALSALLLSAACTKDATQILVVLDSDLEVPAELSSVDVEVKIGPTAATSERFSFSTPASLPASFGVATRSDFSLAVLVKVTANGPAGALFSRQLTTRFLEGKTLRLPFLLPRGCASSPSAPACRDALVPPEALAEVAPGEELSPRPAAALDAGPREDAGVADGDAGAGNDDAAVSDDAGVDPRERECRSGADCLDSWVCLDDDSKLACESGSASCNCHLPCNPFTTNVPCHADQRCYWFDFPPSAAGACVPMGSGGRQNESCTATFDMNGRQIRDDCDTFDNFYCFGASADVPRGTCTRYCTAASDICTHAGNELACSVNPANGFGLCKHELRAQDVGTPCMGPSCEGECSELLGYCTAPCPADLDICGEGEACINTPSESWRCAPKCATSSECAVAGHICDNVNPPGFPELKVCRPPRCTATTGCTAPQTCHEPSGFCQ